MNSEMKYIPQVKICGLTNPEQALGCIKMGASAIGLVFYPKSPRYVSDAQARRICSVLPRGIRTVGVFVNETFSTIMGKVEKCGISAVQLHGEEAPELVRDLSAEKLLVIKALFINRRPFLEDAAAYSAGAYLVEYGRGTLPGGNALEWKWNRVHPFGRRYPLILAGGLRPENIFDAVISSLPDGVDVSSGVESAYGQKDLDKVKAFMNAVSRCALRIKESGKNINPIF